VRKLFKVFGVFLFIVLCFCIFVPVAFADIDVPEVPNTEGMDASDANQLIEQYNNQVDDYNTQVQEEYENQVAEVNAHNEEEDQKVAENAEEIATAEQQNAELQAEYEESLAEAEAHNTAEDAKVVANQEEIANINAENEEIAQQIDAANAHNTAEDEKVAEAEAHNSAEDAKVEASQADLALIETKIENDADVVEHRADDASDAPTDWSDTTQDAKTITVSESDNPTGEKIFVINVHAYVDTDNISQLYESINNDDFQLSSEVLDSAIFVEWETAEIDVDDTVTLESEASLFTNNTIRHDGRNYRLQPYYNYFFRNIEGYTQGYWLASGMIAMTATEVDYGWGYDFATGEGKAGDTYTIHYGETDRTVNYLENGVLKSETIQVRTTDGQAPKNIFALFIYTFTRLWEEPIEYVPDYVNYTPDYVNVPTLLDVPEEYVPNYVVVDTPNYVDVPEVYQPNYQDLPEKPVLLTKLDYLVEDLPAPPVVVDPDPVPQVDPEPSTQVDPDPVIPIIPSDDIPASPEDVRSNVGGYDLETWLDENIPLANYGPVWALVNLVALIFTILTLLKFGNKRYTIFSPILVLSSLILFILTENVHTPMVWVDKWTPWMIAIWVLAVLARVFADKDKGKPQEEMA